MTSPILRPTDRRAFLGAVATGAAFFTTRGLFAEELARTPSRTEGPFYPDKLPLDQDNDLIVLGDSLTPAVGEITHLHGRILDVAGTPLKGLTMEIWQCDANQVYLHSADSGRNAAKQDKNFQGFGRFTTGATGEYRFRTIKPVPYPGRPAPHIHFKIKKGDRDLLTSQINIAGHPGNKVDGVVQGGISVFDRELLMAEFKPVADSKTGELTAAFDVILGRTPDDHVLHALRDARLRNA
ncbi:MAG: intradiol ring-cleavage dioxygenase [Planctomycetales bacterium 71-10]|nr:MAG: intradiol ring-cleavage dioxygenase [Planctomycetales bacterium 71-10]